MLSERDKQILTSDVASMRLVVDATITGLKEMADTVGKSNEREVGEAVLKHLKKEGKHIGGVSWGELCVEPHIKTEVDLLVFMEDEIAVVEAKTTVKSGTYEQLETTAEKMLSFFQKPVLMFAGAPNFKAAYQKAALATNIHAVAINRSRFDVFTPSVRRLELPPRRGS